MDNLIDGMTSGEYAEMVRQDAARKAAGEKPVWHARPGTALARIEAATPIVRSDPFGTPGTLTDALWATVRQREKREDERNLRELLTLEKAPCLKCAGEVYMWEGKQPRLCPHCHEYLEIDDRAIEEVIKELVLDPIRGEFTVSDY